MRANDRHVSLLFSFHQLGHTCTANTAFHHQRSAFSASSSFTSICHHIDLSLQPFHHSNTDFFFFFTFSRPHLPYLTCPVQHLIFQIPSPTQLLHANVHKLSQLKCTSYNIMSLKCFYLNASFV